MNEKQFSDRIGNVNDKLVQQAEQTPNYGREHRKRGVRQSRKRQNASMSCRKWRSRSRSLRLLWMNTAERPVL